MHAQISYYNSCIHKKAYTIIMTGYTKNYTRELLVHCMESDFPF